MKSLKRGASVYTAAFVMTAAAMGGSAAIAAGACPEQSAPGPASSTARLFPPRPVTLVQRADILMARKNYEAAADYYFQALTQSAFHDPRLWNKLGIAFQQQNNFRSARRAYTSATRTDRNFAEAWNNLGTIFFMEKKYRKAVGYYQKALKLNGNVAAFHMNLGSTDYHLKKYAQAVAEYRTAIGIDPRVVSSDAAVGTVVHAGETDAEYYFYMAKALASVGNAEVAVRYLRRALEDGFADLPRIDEDPDFRKISQHPAFVELMRKRPVAIKD